MGRGGGSETTPRGETLVYAYVHPYSLPSDAGTEALRTNHPLGGNGHGHGVIVIVFVPAGNPTPAG